MGIKNKVEYYMRQEGINANELASRTGVTASTIYSMLKRDSSRIDIDLLIKIAKALNITTDELLGYEPQTLAAHFEGDDLTEEEQEEVNSFIKYVKSKRG